VEQQELHSLLLILQKEKPFLNLPVVYMRLDNDINAFKII
jgi:hypothetical protein